MASQYIYPNSNEWQESPFVGKQNLQVQGADVLIHFGNATLPSTYEGYPHIHLSVEDGMWRYDGIEHLYFRTANNNNGVVTNSKIACVSNL